MYYVHIRIIRLFTTLTFIYCVLSLFYCPIASGLFWCLETRLTTLDGFCSIYDSHITAQELNVVNIRFVEQHNWKHQNLRTLECQKQLTRLRGELDYFYTFPRGVSVYEDDKRHWMVDGITRMYWKFICLTVQAIFVLDFLEYTLVNANIKRAVKSKYRTYKKITGKRSNVTFERADFIQTLVLF